MLLAHPSEQSLNVAHGLQLLMRMLPSCISTICFTVLKEWVLISSVCSSATRLVSRALPHHTDTCRQCSHPIIHVRSPPELLSASFILKDWENWAGQAVNPAVLRENTPQGGMKDFFFFQHHSFLYPTHAVAAKPGIPLSAGGLQGSRDQDASHRVGAASCCDGCGAVSLICGHSSASAARCLHRQTGGWIDSGS